MPPTYENAHGHHDAHFTGGQDLGWLSPYIMSIPGTNLGCQAWPPAQQSQLFLLKYLTQNSHAVLPGGGSLSLEYCFCLALLTKFLLKLWLNSTLLAIALGPLHLVLELTSSWTHRAEGWDQGVCHHAWQGFFILDSLQFHLAEPRWVFIFMNESRTSLTVHICSEDLCFCFEHT